MSDSLLKRIVLMTLIGLLLLLTALSMRQMKTLSFWFDEENSFKFVGGPSFGDISLSQTLAILRGLDELESPPAYYLMLNAWRRLVGQTEFASWMLPMLAGLLSVATIYRLGRDSSRHLRLRSSLLIGISAALVL